MARVRVLWAARVAMLAGPTALAFFAGGYFDRARVWAGLLAWVLVAVALLFSVRPLPRGHGVWLALIGLALLAGWTLASFTWAPIAGSAYHAGQRVVLYAGALLAATLLLGTRASQRAVEPALVAGVLIVVGYGLSERLLPGLLHFHRSISAEGRLDQPLTYWNAMGELAALGLVLAARLAGDSRRPGSLRLAAACATAPLGMGLYLTFSRGALFACAAGLVTLLVAAPRRAQLHAILVSLAAGVAGALAAAPFKGMTSLHGSLGTREAQGAITLGLVVVIVLAVAVAHGRAPPAEADRALRLPRRAPWIALALICAGLAVAIVAGAKEGTAQQLAPGVSRYISLESRRYDYWRVAIHAFRDQPLRGVGAGGWAVYWLRWRPIDEGAQDAHSLPLQTAAELGVVGLALLAAFLAGVGIAARRAMKLAPALAAGPLAGVVAYAAHAPLDWDWQLPALTLVALLLAGSLLALASEGSSLALATEADHRMGSGMIPA